MQQLNIEGKRSGDGFVCDRLTLAEALTKANAPTISVCSVLIGSKGFVNYLRLLGGSNMVKVIPSNGNGLKIVCGANVGNVKSMAWTTEKERIGDTCEVRVSPHDAIIPNLGGIELAEAIARVIPYTAKDKDRPVFQCVHVTQKDGKTILECADGFRCAQATLELEAGEGDVLIDAAELKPLTSVIRRARRVRLTLDGTLEIATEATSYKLMSRGGSFPNLDQVIPQTFQAQAQFDTREMRKAAASVNALSLDKQAAVVVTVAEGKLRLTPKDDTEGEAEVQAVTEGEATAALNCAWLLQALRGLGGMAELKVTSATAPVVLTQNGYTILLMPVAIEQQRKEQAEAVAEAEAVVKAKPKRKTKAQIKAEAKAKAEGEAELTEADLVEASAAVS